MLKFGRIIIYLPLKLCNIGQFYSYIMKGNQYFLHIQAEIEVRRLKNELERMNEKQRESMGEQSRRLADVERRYTAQTEQLSTDLSTQWENSTKLTLELEKQRRIETELRRELAQRNSTIDELKKELNTKTSKFKNK